jgi:4-diphosphocytidyl-2-C-methyl-D-erythritol kinase
MTRLAGDDAAARAMSVHRALAPAKVNLGLFLGPARSGDGRHELVTVMQSISLADELTLEPAPDSGVGDELLCPGVPGDPRENLAWRAMSMFRASTGWRAPPLRLSIVKRIPVAAGLGGGSADAAAALRLASHASGLGDTNLLRSLAGQLGADVPAQVSPGRWLATGAGEQLHELVPPSSRFGLLVLALPTGLSTAAVYAEADRLGLARAPGELRRRLRELRAALEHGEPLPADGALLQNDLQPAAVSLCPAIADELDRAREAGAEPALVSGSGPTVVGLFASDELARAAAVAAARDSTGARPAAPGAMPSPIVAGPVAGEFARAVTLGTSGRHLRA